MTSDPETTAKAELHALNDFADRWVLDGDVIRCRCCDRPQQVSWALFGFRHRADCTNAGGERNPWKTLASLLNAQVARANEPTEAEEAAS